MASHHWSVFRVSELLDAGVVAINDGYRMKNEELGPTGVPFVRGGDIQDGVVQTNVADHVRTEFAHMLGQKLVLAGDVAFITKGTVGRVGRVLPNTKPFVVAPQVCYWRALDTDRLDPSFLFYLLGGFEFQCQLDAVKTHGSMAADYVSLTDQRGFRLTLPPIQAQRAISSVLAALDDKIELNRHICRTLETMGRALYKSWFVDFERPPRLEGTEPPLDISVLGSSVPPFERVAPMPDEWSRLPLAEWVSVLSGGTPSKSNGEFWGGDLPWISPKVMTEIHADEADCFVTPVAIGRGTRLAPQGSTLIMVRGMGLHQHVRVSQARREVTFNQDVKALVPRRIEPSLLLFAMLDAQADLLGRVESSGHGTGKLPSEILLAHPIAMPASAEMQVELAKPFDVINDRIALAREESRTLGALRNMLLPRLLSGALRIRDAERAIEAVA